MVDTPKPARAVAYNDTRSLRKRLVRARSESMKRLTKRELQFGTLLYPEPITGRPRTRGECVEGHRPCPYVACKHHLYLDVSPETGSIKLNFPDLEPDELAQSCALDVADRGGSNLERVGAYMNVTRERIRQLEVKALARMARRGAALREYADEGGTPVRRLPVLQGGE